MAAYCNERKRFPLFRISDLQFSTLLSQQEFDNLLLFSPHCHCQRVLGSTSPNSRSALAISIFPFWAAHNNAFSPSRCTLKSIAYAIRAGQLLALGLPSHTPASIHH
ncbi:hypothetical protein BDW59DRAFT_143232 [Aspergillus cavernicola]|uniref:Uncharacterized protein n=1 Tax=Aspergillus cavernicola TaxID=176166 RepID=A0ABR4INP6_9EURO